MVEYHSGRRAPSVDCLVYDCLVYVLFHAEFWANCSATYEARNCGNSSALNKEVRKSVPWAMWLVWLVAGSYNVSECIFHHLESFALDQCANTGGTSMEGLSRCMACHIF